MTDGPLKKLRTGEAPSKPKPDPKAKAPKTPETADGSKGRVAAAFDNVVNAMSEMRDSEITDEAICNLGKLCSRYGSLRENHLARWNEDGTPKPQPEAKE